MTIIFRRICETNLYEWCIICATHLRSTYFWAASLDGSSRCCHNPSILISTNLRRIQREVHFLPSSAQLHKGEFYSSIDLRKWKKKAQTKENFGVIVIQEPANFFLRCVNLFLKNPLDITLSFSLFFVTLERIINRLISNMNPNMSYFKLNYSNLRLELLFQNCLLYFTSCQQR